MRLHLWQATIALCVAAVGVTVTLQKTSGNLRHAPSNVATPAGDVAVPVSRNTRGRHESLLNHLSSIDGTAPQKALGPSLLPGGSGGKRADGRNPNLPVVDDGSRNVIDGTVVHSSNTIAAVTSDMDSNTAQGSDVSNANSGEDANARELARRRCLRRAIEEELRWPLQSRLVYRKGCNTSLITSFADWAARTGCGKAPPTTHEGKLTLHMAWAGKWNEVFAGDIAATLDSFVVTQNLSNTQLLFWFLERPPRGSPTFDALETRFERLAPGAIEFREANITELASGTCVASTPELWTTRGSIPLQTKSDVFRLLVLHKYGGIWIDTDTILLRDVTAVWEYGGEFGGKFAMTLKYNNAFLALRKNSSLSVALLGLICQYPQSNGRWPEYCGVVGSPCHLEWYYNHAPQQWAVRNDVGLVPFPLGLFDPANDCFGRGLLSGSGAYRMRSDWPLSSLLELFRGAFALHTRSYQVKGKDRPLHHDTQFATLFRKIRAMADQGVRGTPIAPAGVRNASEAAAFEDMVKRNRAYTPPDPTFTPPGPASAHIFTQHLDGIGNVVLAFTALVSNGYARTFRVVPKNQALSETNVDLTASTAVWILFNTTGHWMAASNNVVQTYCVDANGPTRPVKGWPTHLPDLNHCDPRRSGQRWAFGNVGGDENTVKIALGTGADKMCFGIAPVADGRFCGALSTEVEVWMGKTLVEKQCLNAALLGCDDPTTVWSVESAERVMQRDSSHLLRTEPLPPLIYEYD